MSITSDEDLRGMKRAGDVVKDTLATLQAAVEVGVTTDELNDLCGHVFAKHGALSAPLMTYGAPVHAFISVNDAVVHGLPSQRKLQAGDVVKLDVTPYLDGYIADAARTVVVPPAPKATQAFVEGAEAAFWAAMKVTRAGKPINHIGRAVERTARSYGSSVIRNLAGHGVGRAIHEAPEVLNFYHPRFRQALTPQLVIAVEPMIAAGRGDVVLSGDGWTIGTRDGSVSAHYENTVIVQQGKPLILTA